MKIVAQSVEYFSQINTPKEEHIARCGRICYASESNSDAKTFYKRLIKSKHLSVLRHASAYYIIPNNDVKKYKTSFVCAKFLECVSTRQFTYIATNEEVAITHLENIAKYRIPTNIAERDPIFIRNKMLRYTFCVSTGIDMTRELNRVSPNNICEQSTRYVDFNKKVGINYKKCHWMSKCNFYQKCLYKFIAKCGEWFYKISRSKYGLNLQPQDARWCLPLDIMSKAVYTYSVKEWERIINLRLWDYTGKAHPDIKIPIYDIYANLELLGYKIDNWKNK